MFDNQILAQGLWFGFDIGEVTCPTRYFAEASSINFRRSVKYGFGVLGTALEYRLAKLGLAHPRRLSKRGAAAGAAAAKPGAGGAGARRRHGPLSAAREAGPYARRGPRARRPPRSPGTSPWPSPCAAGTLALYAQVAAHGFIHYDDDQYVLDNPHVRAGLGLRGVGWAFRRSTSATGTRSPGSRTCWTCSSSGSTPGAHHLVSAALHAANAALLSSCSPA